MNCSFCHQPVPAAPRDERGIPTQPETVHIQCVDEHLRAVDRMLRTVVFDYQGGKGVIEVPRWAPLTLSTEQP